MMPIKNKRYRLTIITINALTVFDMSNHLLTVFSLSSFKGLTMLVITHRKAGISEVDVVYVVLYLNSDVSL